MIVFLRPPGMCQPGRRVGQQIQNLPSPPTPSPPPSPPSPPPPTPPSPPTRTQNQFLLTNHAGRHEVVL